MKFVRYLPSPAAPALLAVTALFCVSLAAAAAPAPRKPGAPAAREKRGARIAPAPQPAVDSAVEVEPLLQRSCVECHGPQRQLAGLRLDRGAKIPARVVRPGRPAESELLRRVRLAPDAPGHMPSVGRPLAPQEIALLQRWIASGARWSSKPAATRHWAYLPPRQAPPPRVRRTGWVRNPIDSFVLSKIEAAGLQPSPEAGPAMLVRRLYLDLTGLPPALEDLNRFLGDRTPGAYERLVDRLLASPRFGERWARHWLDLARYSDSHGFQRDDLRDLWPYRDWVIRALNADMPFDRFSIEQFAGDLLPNPTLEQRIATGFHRAAPLNVEAGSEPEESRVNQVIDRISTMGAIWLGSTLECAQCHDHKYDPISQREYYRLFSYLNNSAIEADREKPEVPGSIRFVGPFLQLPDPEGEARRQRLNAELSAVEEEIAASAAADSNGKGRPPKDLADRRKRLQDEIKEARAPSTLVMQELPAPRATRLMLRGDYRAPGDPVVPRVPAVLHPAPPGPQNRLALARWLVDPANPLVGRVTVNRIWMELWGAGLVRTPEDFGLRGEPPTHPELLDWMAAAFVQPPSRPNGMGWSLKKLIRLIVTSSSYRQSSRITPALRARDPENRLLARAGRFRLEAELIRDGALAASGLLSLKMYGPPVRPYQPPGLWSKVGGDAVTYRESPGEDGLRRGMYTVWKRAQPYASFVNFDAGARLACTVRRSRTNTPLQALTLLNDPVYVRAARALAARLLRELPAAGDEERLRRAFQICLAREPKPHEVRPLLGLLQAAAAGSERPDRPPPPEGLDALRFNAWSQAAAVLLNLDEMITRE